MFVKTRAKNIIRFVVTLLLLSMLLSVVAFSASAAGPHNNITVKKKPSTYISHKMLNEKISKIETDMNARFDKLDKDSYFDKMEKAQNARAQVNAISSIVVNSVMLIKDGDNMSTEDIVGTVLSIAADIAMMFGPWGGVVAGILDSIMPIFNAISPDTGVEAMSEIQCLEDTLLQEFSAVKSQLSDIEDQLTDLSNQMNQSTQTVINEVKNAIELNAAASALEKFYFTTEGNFSYIQYKNLLYGELSNNPYSASAYYKKYQAAKATSASDSDIEMYRTLFCRSVMENRDAFYDYIIGGEYSDSIILRYYEVAKEYDESTAVEKTLNFAADLFITEYTVNQALYTLVFEQYMYTVVNGISIEELDIEKRLLINDFISGELNSTLTERENNIHSKIACDVATVLGLADIYTVIEESGEIYDVVNSDPETFGVLRAGQTVYLNTYFFCKGLTVLNIKFSDYSFAVNGASFTDGKFKVDESTENTVTATLYYRDTPVSTMVFRVDDHAVFYGGSGAESDPYRIGNANGLFAINNDLNAHYELINDIDCSGKTYSPIGRDSERPDKYREFNGTLYGNGHTVSNLTVNGTEYGGLFGIIGRSGSVSGLILKNATVSATMNDAPTYSTYIKCGAIAGENLGTVEYCKVTGNGADSKSSILAKMENETPNRSISLYAGGIVGINYATVEACIVDGATVAGYSTHDLAGELNINANANAVYSGGICGYNLGRLYYVKTTDGLTVKAEGKSTYNPKQKIDPIVKLKAGSITAKAENIYSIISVSSDATSLVVTPKSDTLKCLSKKHKGTTKNVEISERLDYIHGISQQELITIRDTSVDINIDTVNGFYTPDYKFTEIKNEDGSYTVSDQYQAGYGKFKTEGLKFYDGETEITDYTVIAALGFNTGNETAESVEKTVTVVIEYAPDKSYPENTVLLSVPVKITVLGNYIEKMEVEGVEEQYAKGEFSPIGLTLKLIYAVGAPKYISVDATNLDQFLFEGDNTVGVNKYTVTYDGVTAEFNVNINCTHTGNFTNPESGYDEDTAHEDNAAATCTTLGRRVYKCRDCGDIRYLYSAKLPHEAETVNPITPTCEAEGYTGDKVCIHCEAILSNGVKLPKTAHSYVYLDENTHKCGDHTEAHSYTVTEQVVTEINKEGVPVTLVKYLLTCICEISEGVTYTSTVTDENNTPEQANKLPTVAVSKGYVLTEGERTVTVFVQLLNNPGIAAASFGIRYDEGLTLTDVQYGDLLKDSIMKTYNPISHGANFTWADGKVFEGNGNLLKLTFKVSDEAKINDVFGISVVYALKNTDGGFTVDGEELTPFITRAGSITVVDRLPGDVDGDGKVDLFDALLIAKHTTDEISLEGDSLIHADVDLNKKSNTDDIVAILRALTGGYGVDLLSNKFELTVYGNGLAGDSYTVDVDIYGGSYTDAGVKMPSRAGYKFLGFFTRPYGGTQVKLNGNIQYNTSQRSHQAIYAQWEINQITIEGDYTNRPVDKNGNPFDIVIYYPGENGSAPTINVKKEYDLRFVSNHKAHTGGGSISFTGDEKLFYEVDKFEIEGSDNVFYGIDDILNALTLGHIGSITVTPVWKAEPSFNYPESFNLAGYEAPRWYAREENGHFVTQIINGSDILNECEMRAGKYWLYADYTVIEYFVIIDLNNGTLDNLPNTGSKTFSIDLPYPLATNTKGINRQYYKLVGWRDNYGNEYPANTDTVGIVKDAKNGDTVTLTAIWNTTHFLVRYHHNISVSNDNAREYVEYYVPLNTSHTVLSNSVIGFKYSDYRFGKWSTDRNGEKEAPVDSDFICEFTTDTTVVIDLFAQWNQLYYIKYDANNGYDKSFVTFSNNGTQEYIKGEQILMPSDPQHAYSDYISFCGWYLDPACTKEIDTVAMSNNPGSKPVTLYAKWSKLYAIYTSIDTTTICPYTNTGCVILDWRNESDTNVSSHTGRDMCGQTEYGKLDIRTNIRELVFLGDKSKTYTNFYMTICEYDSRPLTIIFDSFNFVTKDAEHAIGMWETYNTVNLNIQVKGDCSITTSASGGNIINLPDCNITFNGELAFNGPTSTMKIVAGTGAKGATGSPDNVNNKSGGDGGNGQAGGAGIIAANVTVNNMKKLEIFGGSGGNGGRGGHGNNKNVPLATARNGGDGGDGGNGGNAINATLTVSNSAIELTGGSGGNGGNGGDNGEYGLNNGKVGAGGNGGKGAAACSGEVTGDTVTLTDGSAGKDGSKGS